MPTLTRSQLADDLHARVGGISARAAADLVDTVFELLKETLKAGTSVKLSGFGNFEVREKHARTGRNPHTGEVITLAPRRVVVFRVSERLRGRINRRAG